MKLVDLNVFPQKLKSFNEDFNESFAALCFMQH